MRISSEKNLGVSYFDFLSISHEPCKGVFLVYTKFGTQKLRQAIIETKGIEHHLKYHHCNILNIYIKGHQLPSLLQKIYGLF